MPTPVRAFAWYFVCCFSIAIGACSRSEPQATSTGTAASESEIETASPSESMSASPTSPRAVAGDGGRAAAVGGNWLKCYASFSPRTRPEIDVLHLGLMCGPSNGMKQVVASGASRIEQGKEREHRFDALAGDCYRVFGVAEPSVEDLDVEVLDPAGKQLAVDTSDDRWPIVKPDGPFCVFADGQYRVVARAQRGAGNYALEIWRLR
jgi:hypothetical protein